MARVADQFTVLAPQTNVWRKVADFSLWGGFLSIPEPEKKGLGGQFARIDGEGADARIGMFDGSRLVQVWQVTEWTPGQRIALAMKEWNLETAAKGLAEHMHPSQARLHASMISQKGALSVTLGAGDVTKIMTLVSIDFEIEFTHPFFGPVFTLLGPIVPLKSTLTAMARSFARKLPEAMEAQGRGA